MRSAQLQSALDKAELGRMVGETKADVLEVIREQYGREIAEEVARALT